MLNSKIFRYNCHKYSWKSVRKKGKISCAAVFRNLTRASSTIPDVLCFYRTVKRQYLVKITVKFYPSAPPESNTVVELI